MGGSPFTFDIVFLSLAAYVTTLSEKGGASREKPSERHAQ